MAIVTEIRENRGMVEVYMEGTRLATIRKAHFAKRPLAAGDDVEPGEYLDSVAAVQFADAYEAALTSLDFSARTAREIEKSLARRGYVPSVARAVTEKLAEAGIIDDIQYAARLAEGAAKKNVGKYAFRRKLMGKGIGAEDAESALSPLDEAQQARAARETAEKLGRKYASMQPREARAKLSQALSRRGFSWDAISGALEGFFDED